MNKSAKPSTDKKSARTPPTAIIDTLEHLPQQLTPSYQATPTPLHHDDFIVVKTFLLQYRGSRSTFAAYRRELEKLLQWSWRVRSTSILKLTREDLEQFIQFCMQPPKAWLGHKRVARFQVKDGSRAPNPDWRLFVINTPKASHSTTKPQYSYSQPAITATFIALSSFYNYCQADNLIASNPVALIRQKSKYIRKMQGQHKVRRLTELQWDFVIETAQIMAAENPAQYERTLFVMSILYLLYLRISELVADSRWAPQMGHFYHDHQNNWWLHTVSKGNKARDISVSRDMLQALKRYRKARQLSPALPQPGDSAALITRLGSQLPLTSVRQIRNIVQACFERAILRLQADGFEQDAQSLQYATVHWLRHTGISDDINRFQRPIAHVRDDAGHSSSATTDRYNDVALQERHFSGQNKQMRPGESASDENIDIE